MLGQSITKNSLSLATFALLTALLVAVVYQITLEPIAEAKIRAAQAALAEIIPSDQHDNNLFDDTLAIPEDYREFLGLTDADDLQRAMHIARRNNEGFAVIIPTVAKDGYSGDIKMILGINKDGTIAGLRVTDHNETPGLGDYIDVKKSNWVLSFNGKDLFSNFEARQRVKKNNNNDDEFDQLTGATITRTAVIRQVRKTLSFYDIAKPLESKPATASGQEPDTDE